MRTLVLRRFLVREILAADEKYVGVLLPPSAAGVVVNAALPLAAADRGEFELHAESRRT